MECAFSGPVWYWRGPAPWYFITVPAHYCQELRALTAFVTYGWGMIPARVRIGNTEFRTALWPKDGQYIVPLKAAVRKAEGVQEGHMVSVQLTVG